MRSTALSLSNLLAVVVIPVTLQGACVLGMSLAAQQQAAALSDELSMLTAFIALPWVPVA